MRVSRTYLHWLGTQSNLIEFTLVVDDKIEFCMKEKFNIFSQN